MNPRQTKFVAEYLKTGNATQAYIAAGYNEKGADRSASRLLGNAEVQQAVYEGLRLVKQSSLIDATEIMNRLDTVYKRCMQAEPVLDSQGNPTGEYKFAAMAAIKSLELMGKQIGMWKAEPPPPNDGRDVTPDLEDAKLTTTELIHMILERRQFHALQVESPREIPIRQQTENGQAVGHGDPKPSSIAGLQELPRSNS